MKTTEQIKKKVNRVLVDALPAKELAVMVQLLQSGRFVEKQRMIDIITNYVGHVESSFDRLVKQFYLATVTIDAQNKVIDDQEAHIKFIDNAVDDAEQIINDMGHLPMKDTYNPKFWKGYVELLERHEKECDNYLKNGRVR